MKGDRSYILTAKRSEQRKFSMRKFRMTQILHAQSSGWRSPPVYRGRGPRSGEGVQICTAWHTPNYSLLTTHFNLHPLTSKAGPLPL